MVATSNVLPSAVWPLNAQRYVTPCASVEPEAVSVKVFWSVSAPGRPEIVGFVGFVASSSQFTVVASLSLPALSTATTPTE